MPEIYFTTKFFLKDCDDLGMSNIVSGLQKIPGLCLSLDNSRVVYKIKRKAFFQGNDKQKWEKIYKAFRSDNLVYITIEFFDTSIFKKKIGSINLDLHPSKLLDKVYNNVIVEIFVNYKYFLKCCNSTKNLTAHKEFTEKYWEQNKNYISYGFTGIGEYKEIVTWTMNKKGDLVKLNPWVPGIFEEIYQKNKEIKLPPVKGFPLPDISGQTDDNIGKLINSGFGVKGLLWGNFLSKQYASKIDIDKLKSYTNIDMNTYEDGSITFHFNQQPNIEDRIENYSEISNLLNAIYLGEEDSTWVSHYLTHWKREK